MGKSKRAMPSSRTGVWELHIPTGTNKEEMDNSSNDSDDKKERLKTYYRNYRQRRKVKNQEVSAQLEATKKEATALQEERAKLTDHAEALAGIYSYSEQLLTTAVFTVDTVRAAVAGASCDIANFENWARHQWVTVTDLMNTSDQPIPHGELKAALYTSKPDVFASSRSQFVDKLSQLLIEAEKENYTDEQMFDVVNSNLSSWAHFALTIIEENKDLFEQVVCRKQLAEYAAALSAEPPLEETKQPSTPCRTSIPRLTPGQADYLRPQWQEFVRTLLDAQQALQCPTTCTGLAMSCIYRLSPTQDKFCAHPGVFRLAQAYLESMASIARLEEFLSKQAKAYLQLFIACLEALTPIQHAHIIVHFQPILPQLPKIFQQLLSDD